MKVAMFSSRSYDIQHFKPLISAPISIDFFDTQLNLQTASLATGYDAVCAFVNDDLSAPVLTQLHELGIKYIAMRFAGFNNIDLFLSNHAFSELNINLQRIYINKYIKNSKNGYMIMNSGRINSIFNQNHLTLTELKKYLPKFKIKKEFIDQKFNNYIIYWKQK